MPETITVADRRQAFRRLHACGCRALPVLALVALLAACASGPQVVSAEPDAIRIAWARGQASEQLVRGLALRYCNGRPIEEVTEESTVGPFSRAKTWKCLGA